MFALASLRLLLSKLIVNCYLNFIAQFWHASSVFFFSRVTVPCGQKRSGRGLVCQVKVKIKKIGAVRNGSKGQIFDYWFWLVDSWKSASKVARGFRERVPHFKIWMRGNKDQKLFSNPTLIRHFQVIITIWSICFIFLK